MGIVRLFVGGRSHGFQGEQKGEQLSVTEFEWQKGGEGDWEKTEEPYGGIR